jgi:transposase-like protein
MATENTPETLLGAINYFEDVDVATMFVANLRWPDGVACPHCAGKNCPYVESRRIWQCKDCRKQFSVKVGSIFEDSPIPLSKWLPTMWLLVNCKNGVSSYEISRDIGVTQKTAWFMLHRLRMAVHAKSFDKFGGDVEVDETFIGGAARNMHKAKRDRVMKGKVAGRTHLTAVVGAIKRGSNGEPSQAAVRVVPNTRRKSVMPFVNDHVSREDAVLITDALKSYDQPPISPWTGQPVAEGYERKVIDHATAYVQGDIHTNSAENFWSLLKRMLRGTYVSVEPFHLFRYLDEQVYRFNNRKKTDGMRFVEACASVFGKRLTYSALIGKELPETC